MYAITGVTGHVGKATAHALLAAGHPVRAVARDTGRIAAEGYTETAEADFTDREALAKAFTGARGVFVMLPTLATFTDAQHRAMADTIAAAVADSQVSHVVMLSSLGAELAEGTGPIRWLHHMENALRATGTTVTALRSTHFQEKVEELLGAATTAGIYPVFGDDADTPKPMIATTDVGAAAAEALLDPPATSQVVDLNAPEYSERQVAEKLGAALGRQLEVVTIPQPAWHDAMTTAGIPPMLATELAGLYEAEAKGLLTFTSSTRRESATPIEETLKSVLQAS